MTSAKPDFHRFKDQEAVNGKVPSSHCLVWGDFDGILLDAAQVDTYNAQEG